MVCKQSNLHKLQLGSCFAKYHICMLMICCILSLVVYCNVHCIPVVLHVVHTVWLVIFWSSKYDNYLGSDICWPYTQLGEDFYNSSLMFICILPVVDMGPSTCLLYGWAIVKFYHYHDSTVAYHDSEYYHDSNKCHQK